MMGKWLEGAVVGMFVGLLAGVSIGAVAMGSAWRFEVTKRHYGGYCQDTGEWRWNGDCEASK